MVEMLDNGPQATGIRGQADTSTYRSVYLPLLRGVTPRTLEAFDPVEQTLVTGSRDTTTVPGQALYLLNSEFVRRQSLALADRLVAEKDATDPALIGTAYRLILGREPTEKEIERARVFLGEYESVYRQQPPPAVKPKPKPPAKPKAPAPPPANPDDADQTGVPVADGAVHPKDARTAAWLAFVQALFASAEFRYVR
jgi:hypothetical protein